MGLGIRTRLRRLRDGERDRRRVPRGARGDRAAARARGRARGPRADDGPLDVAVVVPFFRQGSGGHTTIANLVRGLERLGHRCSLWIDDPGHRCAGGPAGAERDLRAWFGPFAADVHYGFDAWRGADVVVATGWQTVARVRVAARRRGARLPRPGPRARVLRDLRAAAVGRGLLPPRAVPDHRRAVAGRGHGQRVRAAGDALRAGRRHRALPPAGRRRAATTWCSSTRARARRGGRCRSRSSRSASSSAGGRRPSCGSTGTAGRRASTTRSATSAS